MIDVGSRAIPFSGTCSDGQVRSLEDYTGRALILVFLRHLG
jgi:peroxiredoxin